MIPNDSVIEGLTVHCLIGYSWSSGEAWEEVGLLFLVQAVDAADGAVLGHEEVSLDIEGDTVGCCKDARTPLDPGCPVGAYLVRVVIVADLLHYIALLVEEGYAPLDFTNGSEVAVNGGTGGKQQTLGNLTDKLAVKRHVDDAHVGPVGAEESGRGEAVVQDNLVQGPKLVGFTPATEGGDVFAVLVEAVDIIG